MPAMRSALRCAVAPRIRGIRRAGTRRLRLPCVTLGWKNIRRVGGAPLGTAPVAPETLGHTQASRTPSASPTSWSASAARPWNRARRTRQARPVSSGRAGPSPFVGTEPPAPGGRRGVRRSGVGLGTRRGRHRRPSAAGAWVSLPHAARPGTTPKRVSYSLTHLGQQQREPLGSQRAQDDPVRDLDRDLALPGLPGLVEAQRRG